MNNRLLYLLGAILLLSYSCSSNKNVNTTLLDGKNKEVAVASISNESRISAERIFFDANKEKLIGNIAEAEDLFKQSVRINPTLDAAYYELAQIELSKSNYEGAEKYVSKALGVDEENVYYREFYGDIFAAQYKFAEAALVFHKLRESYPDRINYYLKEAFFLTNDKQYKEALDVYDELESKIGLQENIAVERHKIYIKQNKLDAAAAELEKLVNANPGNPEYVNKLADFYSINGQKEKAVAMYLKIIEEYPDDVMAITALADYYKSIGDDENYLKYSTMAFGSYQIPIDAKISVLYNYIQFFEENKANIEGAFHMADVLIETHPKEAKAYAIAGDLRNLNNEPLKALEFYEQSLALRQDIYTVWQQVFFILSDEKNYTSLADKTAEAMEFFPNQPTVYYFNGIANHQQDKFEQAAKVYERGAKMTIDNPPLKAQFYSNLGDVYNSLKQYKDSDEAFDNALEIEPQNAYVLNNYSYYLSLRKERLDDAAQMSKLSNELEPQNPSFLDTYAWVLYQQGKFTEALEWQDKAIQAADQATPTLLEHYGDILFQLNRIDEAVNYWKQARDAGSDSETLLLKISDRKLHE